MPAVAQSPKKIRSLFNEAESILLYNEDYEQALPLYRMLADMVPDNHNYQYKLGICYLNTPGKVENAIPWLKKSSLATTLNYSYSYKETHAPVDVFFYIGSAYHILNKTDSAVYYYKKFLQQSSRSQNPEMFYNRFVRQQIKNCAHAREMEQQPVRVRKEKMPEVINAFHKNMYPVISGNEKVLVYTAFPGSNQSIMCSNRKKHDWTRPVNITGELNAGDDSRATALSYTGDTLFVYKEEGGEADLWVSYHHDTVWTPMKRLGRNINTKYWESSCCLSTDGKTLYFTSNREGGVGGLDIYLSHRNEDGRWGPAINLGNVINTPLLEDNPYLTKDGKTLYFASQGHYNMGGFDIFYSKQKKSGEWSRPINLGYPVNTTDENRYYFPVGTGDTSLISLFNTDGDSPGNWDIYKIHIISPEEVTSIELRGTIVFDDGARHPDTSLTVTISDTTETKIQTIVKPDSQGLYKKQLLPGTYLLTFQSKKYKPARETVIIPKKYPQSFLAVETHLKPRETDEGDIFFIRSVYFGLDTFSLNLEAREHLIQLATLLKEYPSLKFDIAGMTDTTGTKNHNQRLSVKRAHAVIDFLNSMGIQKKRFTLRGIGEIKIIPLGNGKVTKIPSPALSRRVEIRLIRPDTSIKYKEEYFLPEYASRKNHFTYSILILKVKKKLPADYFYRFNMEELNYVKVDEINGEYYYTLGSFKQKNRAIALLSKLYKVGFSQARILDDPTLEEMLHTPAEKKKSYVGRSEYIQEDIPYYTIQIYALHHPPNKGAFKHVRDIRVWACKDKFFRYTVGYYHGYSKALLVLPDLRKMGYKDAFIQPVSSLEKLKKE